MASIPFTHLHVHSQYSILDGQASVNELVSKAVEDGMSAIALTDHGTMLGIKDFFDTCKKKKIKPIAGIEAYVAERTIADKTDKVLDRSGRHLILLAKNKIGYRNLLKLTTIAHVKGLFYRPRIDKILLQQYHEGLIVTSACLGGEIPRKIMNNDLDGARDAILWYKNLFGDDFYLELQRHPAEDLRMRRDVYENQVAVNEKLLEFSTELGVKVVAANDVHFAEEKMAEAHDIMICLNTGKDQTDESRMRYTRQEWFKTTEEMNRLFADIPQALESTREIAEKVEEYEINSDPIMPLFPIPEEFGTWDGYKAKFTESDLKKEFGEERYEKLGGDFEHMLRIKLEADYLEHLTYIGAKRLYADPVPDNVRERIDFELNTVKTMGFPGYFLIVQDFINAAREMEVLVGPGRGSAAGSAVAYCVGITAIDPIKFDLLFERFLNPDRISMPDVDIDFDDDGRQLVLDWVANKYGHDKVAHICTLGTMAAKSAIKDVGRVLKLPLSETDRISKRIPERPGTKLANAFSEILKLERELGGMNQAKQAIDKKLNESRAAQKEKEILKYEVYQVFAEEIEKGRNEEDGILLKTLEMACDLEGSIRQTGVHACGVLIGRDPLDEHIPLMPAKDANLLVTQYEGNLVESIGLLKMDFLGLKTLSIIKEALEAIKISKGEKLNLDTISYEDEKTFQLFSRGETTAIFQFESAGMKKYLRELQPNRFEDLVAMNALYRPGPMEYIPNYVARKHGREEIIYDHPLMETYLDETYGITVFQEQVMLLSRELAGFTRGESDSLRKAMGKKVRELMDKLKIKFDEGCKKNPEFIKGCEKVGKKPEVLIEKIWKDWEAFASYAFNKSHSVCYANLAYQTGYLKAHYPAEFMAGVLSRNLNDITKITTFMEECRRMNMEVLGPDVNESFLKFTVNKKGALRFGMAAVKGVGEGVVIEIINERGKNGPFKDVFDFVERVSLQVVNKKAMEALAGAGAFDNLGKIHRAQYFAVMQSEEGSFIERLLRYGNRFQTDQNSNQNSLFGSMEMAVEVKRPDIPQCLEFSTLEKLEKEKELIGMYLSAHPLDDFRLELKHYCKFPLKDLNDLEVLRGRDFTVGGMVTNVRFGKTRVKSSDYAILTLEDYSGSFEFPFFGQDYVDYRNYLETGQFIMIKGKVQGKKFKPEELEAKMLKITLLGKVLEDQVRNLTLRIPLQSLTTEVVTELAHVSMENKGGVTLRFQIYDEENEQQTIKLLSRSVMVNLTGELVSFFEERPEISIELS
jgi:DNA polymerase III subunit alpha